MTGAALDWDAATYDRVADPQEQWAREIVARMHLRGDEFVLDAGCGSGRVTRLLLEGLSRGRVIAADASPAMVERARQALAGDHRVEVTCQDLLELQLHERVDAIFSCAVFHHIFDHERLFDSLRGALAPGGRLVAQCGGAGNIDAFRCLAETVASRPRYDEYMADMRPPWHYATPEATEQRLRAAGFEEIRCWLQDKLTLPSDARGFAQTVLLNYHLDHLRKTAPPSVAEQLASAFTDEVLAEAGDPLELHYVRLNIEATAA